MPEDIAVPVTFGGSGDLSTVDGDAFYQQHALLLAVEAVADRVGGPLTSNDRVEIVAAVERTLAASPYFGQPSVSVTESTATSVTLRVLTGAGRTFDIPVDERDETVTPTVEDTDR